MQYKASIVPRNEFVLAAKICICHEDAKAQSGTKEIKSTKSSKSFNTAPFH
jgi:hypothetical protein